MRNLYRFAAPCTALCLFWSHAATAADEPQGLGGEAELGVVSTSGNTNTRSINGKAKMRYLSGPWRHEVRAEGLRTSDGSTITAERYLLAGKSDYHFRPHDYLFATARYEDDRFSGYDYQLSEALGYGHRTLDQPDLTLDLEIGAGGRHSKEQGGTRKDEAILRGAAKLGWDISPTARFTEDLLAEAGRDNTYTESVTALKVKINGNFAMKLSLTVKNNSTVPAGTRQTDTLTAVTLVYDF